MLLVITTLLFAIYVFTFLRNSICLWMIDKWLSKKQSPSLMNEDFRSQFYLIVPMLNEQSIAKETARHFAELVQDRPHFHAVFVTTEKEVPPKGLPYTHEILAEIADNEGISCIKRLHYPQSQGVMAHQLNYAVEQIRTEHPDGDFWIGIYNADSRIDGKTLDYVSEKVALVDQKNSCFQQYSWYPSPSNARSKSIIDSASLWQNRWSLTFELPRVLFQLLRSFINKIPKNIACILEILIEKMNYVIGHGLFIHAQTLHRVGEFPEDSINEDAFLGYLLNNERVDIYPLPVLEESEFAPNVDIYIRQQTTWFNGPWYAFQYLMYYLRGNSSIHPSRAVCKKSVYGKFRAISLAMKLFLHAVYWLVSPLLLLIVLPLSLAYFAGWKGLVLCLALIFAHLPLTHYFTRLVVTRHVLQPRKVAKPSILFCIFFYLVHCFGPLRNLYQQIIGVNTIHRKYKTERVSRI